ncbi:hypothetical protein [Agrobacterium vitis]
MANVAEKSLRASRLSKDDQSGQWQGSDISGDPTLWAYANNVTLDS